MFRARCAIASTCLALIASWVPAPTEAQIQPPSSEVRAKAFRHPDLYISNQYQAPAALPAGTAGPFEARLAELGASSGTSRVDVRTGRWGTLLMNRPMIPGTGIGNQLEWDGSGSGPASIKERAWEAFEQFLDAETIALGIDPSEIGARKVTVHDGGALVQIWAERRIEGIRVRDSYLTAVINHGNLVLMGARNWGDVAVDLAPSRSEAQIAVSLEQYLAPLGLDGFWKSAELELVPVSRGELTEIAIGTGLEYRLAWRVRPSVVPEDGMWEAWVDAHNGELLLMEDTRQYAAEGGGSTVREIKGGVLPIANDGIVPDGVEQAGWPMPWSDVSVNGEVRSTDGGGNLLVCTAVTVFSELSGTYMRMDDQCGAISLSSSGDVDFGTSGGTDCTAPAFGGPGNTHASRSGFYEMNRIKEMARSHLPGNSWLDEQLTSVMNINNVCNAFWGGGTVNFYRSGGGCANTGEVAAVYDHEWGHGLDDNDANPSISNPGEGIPDVYASLRLNTSCIGRSFRQGNNCGGYGDPCTACDGVRDIDWAMRSSGVPHDVTAIDALCGSGGGSPCGGSSHCEGAVYAEAVWDLWNRDLQAVYGMDLNTAREIGTRLTFLGASPVGSWFQCSTPFGGCNADGGYLNYLAADDDDGNLANGTPHMQAIFDAFDRHGIACNTPAVADSGCAGVIANVPTPFDATPVDRGVELSWSWSPVGPAAEPSQFDVYRAEGVAACAYGKTLVGSTTGNSFVDTGLQNGRDYSYVVIPKFGEATCFGAASACVTATPAPGPNVSLDEGSMAVSILTGDGDTFVDNCESTQLTFDVYNVGTGPVNNVRIVGVTSSSHPGQIQVQTALPSVLGNFTTDCQILPGSVTFSAGGLAFDDTLVLEILLAADGVPGVQSTTVEIPVTESDLQSVGSRTWTFEGNSSEDWTTAQGTFSPSSAGGGAQGTSWYMASSTFLDDQCDQVHSPVVALSASSTLSVWNNFDIEAFSGQWWDRANVGISDVATGARTAVSPDGGRAYNASGIGGTCGLTGEAGWADSSPSWAESSWTAGALGAGGIAGDLVRLDVRYGTDAAVNGAGFWFDQVTLTNFDLQVADAQGNSCDFIFLDGFESGDTTVWDGQNP